VTLEKGDFLGRAALLGQRATGGPRRRLVGFEIDGRGIAREGAPVWVGGELAGKVTSGTWSPTFEKALGMAYVPAEHAATGTSVEIEVRGKRLPATVSGLPFYKRPKRA
jgi:aminomethyltransferase